MVFNDDDLAKFRAGKTPALPGSSGSVEHEGARIWYAEAGHGPAVILLHGGLGHAGNWGYQVPALVDAGYRTIAIDSRGHGHSTRDDQPYSYDQLASDTRAVMDALGVDQAAIVGWSDGACAGLALARQTPERMAGLLFFACNVDPSGAKPFEMTPTIDACIARHRLDYAALSTTPDSFDAFSAAVGDMQSTQPNYTPQDLREVKVPVTVLHAEHDEFINADHAAYLARTISGATLRTMAGVSHFAPLQRPALFNAEMLRFLKALAPDDKKAR